MDILLVDDPPLFCDAAAALVARHWPKSTLHACGTLAQALARLAERARDLLLLDLSLRDSDGLATLAAVREAAPQVAVVVLSADARPATVMAAIDAGAAGYITKSSSAEAMRQALQTVFDGGEELRGTHALADLSARQIDVLRLLLRGLSNKAMANELQVYEATIKTHVAALFRKLEVDNRTQAVLAAARLGLRLAA
jgi:DNA-binding NarL/FixJ family response regulator